jgi:hypothetical protein
VSVTIALRINRVAIPVELDEIALATIAAAITPTGPMKEWFNVESAAAYMDVAPERVRKLIARGAVAYSQEGAGCRVLLRRADVDAYLIEHRHERRGA